MEQMTAQIWTVEAEREALRRRIEEKRKKLDSNIKEKGDLLGLEQQKLSRELDFLIEQYVDLQ